MTEPVLMTQSASLLPSASISAELHIPEGTCTLTYTPINVDKVINSVRDDGAGATAVFIGEFQAIVLRFMLDKSEVQELRATLSKVCSPTRGRQQNLRLDILYYREDCDSLGIPSVLEARLENYRCHCP